MMCQPERGIKAIDGVVVMDVFILTTMSSLSLKLEASMPFQPQAWTVGKMCLPCEMQILHVRFVNCGHSDGCKREELALFPEY